MTQNEEAVAATPWQSATLIDIVRRTSRVTSFYFRPAKPFRYRAGQHADIRLTAPDGYSAQRSYSIASAPDGGDVVELAIERLDGGEVSAFFHDVAQVGDDFELRAPLGGHFVWSVADQGPLVLIGGGSGIVPLMSMLRHRAARKSDVPALALFSFQTWDDIIFREELLALQQGGGLMLAIALTREPARRSGDYSRRIDDAMVRGELTKIMQAPRHAFVCGTNSFAETASDALIAAGVDASIIRTERYGGV